MESEEEVKKAQTVEDQARNVSHKVRCTECRSQSLEDRQILPFFSERAYLASFGSSLSSDRAC